VNDSLFHILLVAGTLLLVSPIFWAFARTRNALQRALREASVARDRLNDALEGSLLAVFDWDMVGGSSVRLSPTWPVMLGGEAIGTQLTAAELFALVHPDDVQKVRDAVVETLKGNVPRYDVVHRVRRSDGTYAWVHSRGKVTARDARGRATRFAGTNADISARVIAEERLKEREMQLRQLIDTMPAAIVVFGTDEHVLFHNRAYLELTGLSAEAVNGRRMQEVVG